MQRCDTIFSATGTTQHSSRYDVPEQVRQRVPPARPKAPCQPTNRDMECHSTRPLNLIILTLHLILNLPIPPPKLMAAPPFPFHSPTPPPGHQPSYPLAHSVNSELLESYESYLQSAKSEPLARADRNLCVEFVKGLSSSSNNGSLASLAVPESPLPVNALLTSSTPRAFHVGTGLSVTTLLSSIIASAESEVLFVTCFWAPSESRQVFSNALRTLSERHVASGRKEKVRVRIGFSSSGVWQKLSHPSTPKGKVYPPETWGKLGLPSQQELEGLDMGVRSIFYLPFSVLHGKFCVVDRKVLVLPSSNVSWEVWGECASVFEGGIVNTFLKFWKGVWGFGLESESESESSSEEDLLIADLDGAGSVDAGLTPIPAPVAMSEFPSNPAVSYPTLFIPQPHHRNPKFRFPRLSCLSSESTPLVYPQTPQNAFILLAIGRAEKSVYIQTPNLTSQPLIDALAAAVRRGVVVELVTCRRMMLLEQIVTTAGVGVTEWCVKRLVKRVVANGLPDGERGAGGGGGRGLWVYYYTGAAAVKREEEQAGHVMRQAVKSHVKALVVDDRITVLGSANGDRASWYTSQEVNVAVFSEEFAGVVRRDLVSGLGGRLECVYAGREGECVLRGTAREGMEEV